MNREWEHRWNKWDRKLAGAVVLSIYAIVIFIGHLASPEFLKKYTDLALFIPIFLVSLWALLQILPDLRILKRDPGRLLMSLVIIVVWWAPFAYLVFHQEAELVGAVFIFIVFGLGAFASTKVLSVERVILEDQFFLRRVNREINEISPAEYGDSEKLESLRKSAPNGLAPVFDVAQHRPNDSESKPLKSLQSQDREAITDLRRLSRWALTIGMLGTFWGLALALPEMSELLNNGSSELRSAQNQSEDQKIFENLKPILYSLGTCFSTSVAGLGTSLFVSILSARFQRKRNKFYFELQKVVPKVFQSLGIPQIYDGEQLEENFGNLINSQKLLRQQIGTISENIVQQSKAFREGNQDLMIGRDALNSFVQGVEIVEKASLKSIGQISTQLKEGFTGIDEPFQKSSQALESASAALAGSATLLSKQVEEFEEAGNGYREGLNEASKEFAKEIERMRGEDLKERETRSQENRQFFTQLRASHETATTAATATIKESLEEFVEAYLKKIQAEQETLKANSEKLHARFREWEERVVGKATQDVEKAVNRLDGIKEDLNRGMGENMAILTQAIGKFSEVVEKQRASEESAQAIKEEILRTQEELARSKEEIARGMAEQSKLIAQLVAALKMKGVPNTVKPQRWWRRLWNRLRRGPEK